MSDYSYQDIAKMIDHSLLHPTMTDKELEDGDMEAINRAIEAASGSVGRVRAWSGYQSDSYSGYSQPFGPRYYSSEAGR